ncbi:MULTISPECIES: YxeA family protein [Bacillus cereus group]|uniref:YxeA family protein n=1 Tax=Bacillus cereus group TaxID=86661 RepID=UPI00065B9984|nr:YxeA family protein [Bacillus cereus]MED2789204.1 YxeA family protein [Bacillus thuringiensis]KMP99194.1 membrane protein [Bacillus cereus]MED2811681.1 YxeA family protein [Bacillus thuringiensis]MED2829780.1 YxeA family protein [Bacillus thuringiensis]MED2833947.1 YxeA family protein [Bacillus thuringiensis]
MKKYMALFSLLVVFASLLVGCDINRMGKDEYYVQITMDGKEGVSKSMDGKVMGKEYEYTLSGFDKEGKEKELEFMAQKNLRKEAFLRVYHSEKKGVTAWEEVQEDELPKKAKEKLSVK